jgi:SNF family Na+-dependent transporter
LFLGLIWLAIFLCVSRGITVMGKVSLILMPICPILLIVLLIRGLMLDGAFEGIMYYVTPQFESLLKPNVWMDAASQIFFSIGLAGGVIPALASYASTTQDLVIDTFVITCSNSFVELSAGFIVFSYLGNLAKTLAVPVGKVAASGPSLAFIVFPEALSKMPWSNFFCVLFFLTLLLLGITSAYTMVQSIVTSIRDFFPQFNVSFIAFIVCFFEFCLGLLYTTPVGYHLVDLVDHYTGIMLLVGGLAECFVVFVHSVPGVYSAFGSINNKFYVYRMPNLEELTTFSHENGSLVVIDYIRKCINRRTVIPVPRSWTYVISLFAPVVIVLMIFATIIFNPMYGNYPPAMQLWFGWLPFALGLFVIASFLFYHSKIRHRLSFAWRIRNTRMKYSSSASPPSYQKINIEMQNTDQ